MIYRIVQIDTNIIHSQCVCVNNMCQSILHVKTIWAESTTIQLPEWNNVHIDMQESQQNDSKQLDWYAPWPWTRIFKTKKQTGSISVVLETGKTQASRKWTSIHQAYKHAINRGQFGNSWSHPVSPIHIWFHLMEGSFQRCGLRNARPMQPRRHRKNDQQSEPVSSPKPGSGCCQTDCGPPTFKDFLLELEKRICMKSKES